MCFRRVPQKNYNYSTLIKYMRRRIVLALFAASGGLLGLGWIMRGDDIGDWEECPCEQVEDVSFDIATSRGVTRTIVTISFHEEFHGHVRVDLLDQGGEVLDSATERVDGYLQYEVYFSEDRTADVALAISED